LRHLIGVAALPLDESITLVNGYPGVYAIIGIRPTAAKMNGNQRATTDAIRFGLKLALAVSMTVKSGAGITSYSTYLPEIEVEHQRLMAANLDWINTTFGPGSSIRAKSKILSILHLDLGPMKLLFAAAKSHTQDMNLLFKICFACVVTEDLFMSALQLFTHFEQNGLKLWLKEGVRAVLSQKSIVPRLLQVVKCTSSNVAEHLFSLSSFACLNVEKQDDVITSNPSISHFVIQGDALQSLVLLQLMKRDEASLKYDAINPHQVYKLGLTTEYDVL
jgi:hypothetical protein